jgi:DNA-binding MarR family transcriptional regulator
MHQLRNGLGSQKVPGRSNLAGQSVDLESFAPYLLNQVTSRLNLGMQEHLRAHRVSVPQWRVLCLLTVNGAQSIGALAASSVIPQSTLSRVVDQIERGGLVERRPRPQNNRVIEVHLTKQGRVMFDRILPAALAVRDDLISELSEADHRQFLRILRKLLERLRQSSSGRA